MKIFRVVFFLLLVMLLSARASAFDCERKGFVIGVGVGHSPLMIGSRDKPAYDFDDESGLGVNFIIGYAWNNTNMILLQTNLAGYEDTVDVYVDGDLVHQNEIQLTQGFTGLTYRRYFSSTPRSFYATAGIGMQAWIANEWYNCHRGIGFLIGGGYEFIKHFEIDANYSFGFTETCSGVEYKHSQIIFTITGVLY